MVLFCVIMNIEFVFGEMLCEWQYLGMVYDDLGIWVGLIIMEDIIEILLGYEIMDEMDNVFNLCCYVKQWWSWWLKKCN